MLTQLQKAEMAAGEGSENWAEGRLLEAPFKRLCRSRLWFSQPNSMD